MASGSHTVCLRAEQFSCGKLIPTPPGASNAARVIGRSPGVTEAEALRIIAATSLGSSGQFAYLRKAYGFLCTRGWAVAVLYQAKPDPRGTYYLASHFVLTKERNFKEVNSNFRHLTDLLPADIMPAGEFKPLEAFRQSAHRLLSDNLPVVKRALDRYGTETLKRLLEPYFTGAATAHIAFRGEADYQLDLLEALALLVPPILRKAASFATEVIAPAECDLQLKFAARPMIGLGSHLIVLWHGSQVEVARGHWDEDPALRKCSSFFDQFDRLGRLDEYLEAINSVGLVQQPASPPSTTAWADALSRVLEPLLSPEYR